MLFFNLHIIIIFIVISF